MASSIYGVKMKSEQLKQIGEMLIEHGNKLIEMADMAGPMDMEGDESGEEMESEEMPMEKNNKIAIMVAKLRKGMNGND